MSFKVTFNFNHDGAKVEERVLQALPRKGDQITFEPIFEDEVGLVYVVEEVRHYIPIDGPHAITIILEKS